MDKPNIILINCDDLGYGDLGCYGSTLNKTPYIDSLAADGTLCTDFYVGSPVCSPSRASLMTGCYPPRIGFDLDRWVLFPGDEKGLPTSEIALPRMLKEAGYATGMVGKWHCGDQPEFLPTRHGFDSFYGLPYSNDMGRQNGGGPDTPPLPLMQGEEVIEQQPNQESLTERYTERCVQFIRDNKERPFFLYFAHFHPHLPLYAPYMFREKAGNGDYGACVEEIDWSVGVLLAELKRLSLEKDTLVIFTSDNGSRGDHGGCNAPLRGKKGQTWEAGQRVPLILHQPGTIPAGRRFTGLLAAMDITVGTVKLGGGKLPQDRIIDGLDISPLLAGDESFTSPRETFYYYIRTMLEAVRHGDWKLHVSKEGQPVQELYNLRADMAESHNLYSEQPQIVAKLEALLEQARQDMGDSVKPTEGKNRRPIGRVENPDTLTHYDPEHPYIISLYDRDDIG